MTAIEGERRPRSIRLRHLRRASNHPVCRGLVISAVLLASSAEAHAQTTTDASAVVAAFVSRFPQFVEWPATALEGRERLEICVWEPDPFGADLEALIEAEEVAGRRLAVRRIDRFDMVDGCHALFVSPEASYVEPLLENVGDHPVLTIGQSRRFLDLGGIINLVIIDRRVRFEVNATAAERAGLRLSSQLLGLAIDVVETS